MMKKIVKHSLFTLMVLTLGSFTLVAQAAVKIEHWQQANGTAIWLGSSMGIPMVDVHVEFDAGSRRDPVDKVGLAAAVATVASKGVMAWRGRPAMDAAALGDAWTDLGAEFSLSAGDDTFAFELRSLTYDDILPKAVALAAHQMAAPSFDPAVAERERERAIAALKEAQTQPDYVAQVAFQKAVFGQHPYGYVPTEASLNAISLDDLRQFYQSQLPACRAKVSIVGAVNREQADQLVATLLQGLAVHDHCPEIKPLEDAPALTQASVETIDFDSAQAQVLIGQPAMKRSDPDYFPIVVGNYILGGGGFVSRLTEQVREKRGLSYSVYSYFAPRQNVGEFQISLQTRPDQAQQAIDVAMQVVRDFVAQGATEAELKAAKDNLIGGFALHIDSNRKLLDNIANMASNGLPLDYLDTWTQQVDAVSLADIQRAFQAKLQPDRMATVTVGAAPAAQPTE